MAKLITGGTGFIGAELAHSLVGQGEEIVLFDVVPNWERIRDIKDKVKLILGNLANSFEVLNAIKENKVVGIYHLGGMLSLPSEANPQASFQANICGTMNVLEAARLFNVARVVFTSTFGTYSLGVGRVITDDTLQRPTTMYGCGKVYCELLGTFYRRRYALDFRSVRLPSIVGPGVRTPGVAQYNSLMIEKAALGEPYECYVAEDTRYPGVMYFKDVVRCLEMAYQAPMEQIKTVNYNVAGLRQGVTAGELELLIKKHVPEFSVIYKPDPKVMAIFRARAMAEAYDDTPAREEWGWEPVYDNMEKQIVDFIQEVRTRPEYYGLTQ
jgi:threonine 3-dehydrogenase